MKKPIWKNTKANRLKLYKATLERMKKYGVATGLCVELEEVLLKLFDCRTLDDDNIMDMVYNEKDHYALPEIHYPLKKMLIARDNTYAWPAGIEAPRIEFLEKVIAEMETKTKPK